MSRTEATNCARAEKWKTTGGERYPVPTEPPEYEVRSRKVSGRKRTPVWDVVAALYVVIALIFVGWLAMEMALHARPGDSLWVANLIAFWAVTAYLAVPRIHQILTLVYVPDYFIGRTRTGDGVLGDPVNLAIDGTADDIHAGMQAAGWTLADDITLRSSWRIIVSSVFNRPYPSAPVSNLYLFGRKQAFAYQKEVDGNASRRHHVRFWPTPEGWYLPGGQRVDFLAAGTYDRSVGFSLLTGQITHKVDADIDAERDFIIDTLRYTDRKIDVVVINNFSTAYHSRNGGGDAINTDGDMPVLNMCGAAERDPAPTMPRPDESVARHHIPPLPLVFTGMLALWGFIFAGIQVVIDPQVTVSKLVMPAIEFTLWLLTAARHRWAWVGLMTISSVTAFSHLLILDFLKPADTVLTGISVFVVLAVSATAVREWVRGGNRASVSN